MTRNWQIMMMMTGCLITSSIVCIAQQDKMSMKQFDMEDVAPFAISRTAYPVAPSENFQGIFKNIYHEPNLNDPNNLTSSWKAYGQQLRSKLALHWGDYFQLSVNKIKAGSLKPQKTEIVDVNSHLLSASSDNLKAQGYGVEMKVRLD